MLCAANETEVSSRAAQGNFSIRAGWETAFVMAFLGHNRPLIR